MRKLGIPEANIAIWEKAARESRLKRLAEARPRRSSKTPKIAAPTAALPTIPGGLLICSYCGKSKPCALFIKTSRRAGELGVYAKMCAPCRENGRIHRKKSKMKKKASAIQKVLRQQVKKAANNLQSTPQPTTPATQDVEPKEIHQPVTLQPALQQQPLPQAPIKYRVCLGKCGLRRPESSF
ncbi:hypothetical protein IWX90DRAFT_428565 [Phyllosticta citrichinensis]|uniref:Uncharacterized protein n=1 Tax=Phyllosticta citrichinensis TaxID=1130410 RepID=A0ABR1Y0N0_9PEZI